MAGRATGVLLVALNATEVLEVVAPALRALSCYYKAATWAWRASMSIGTGPDADADGVAAYG